MTPNAQGMWLWLAIYRPDEEIRRRVKLATATHNKKLSEFCEAVPERLEQDEEQSCDNLQKEIEELRTWQEQIRAGLRKRTIPDTVEVTRRLRKERTRAIAGLR